MSRCYRTPAATSPPAIAARALHRYLAARPELDAGEFRTAYAICAAQRHLRVAAQWVRLALREGQPRYLAHGPRTWGLLAARLARAGRRAAGGGARPLAAGGNARQSGRAGGVTRPDPPRTAMVLAAGLGTRMRPLTEATAKPLLPLGGKPLLDHTLDRLAAIGVTRVVVNAHWRAERVAAHLAARREAGLGPDTVLSAEPALLDTGGGVRAALTLLGAAPFFVINGDAFWLDGSRPALLRLADAFATGDADAVLLAQRACQVQADIGLGDFFVDPWGVLRRRGEREVAPFIYAGLQIVDPALLADVPDGAFSMNLVWDRAMRAGRLRGVVHDGLWFHLSTPADLAEAEFSLHAQLTGETR